MAASSSCEVPESPRSGVEQTGHGDSANVAPPTLLGPPRRRRGAGAVAQGAKTGQCDQPTVAMATRIRKIEGAWPSATQGLPRK
jgi:hypothetical protein